MIDQIEQDLGRELTEEEKTAIEYGKRCTKDDITGSILVPIDMGLRCVRIALGEVVLTDGRVTLHRGTRWTWSRH